MRRCFAKVGFLSLCGVWVCLAAVPPMTAAAGARDEFSVIDGKPPEGRFRDAVPLAEIRYLLHQVMPCIHRRYPLESSGAGCRRQLGSRLQLPVCSLAMDTGRAHHEERPEEDMRKVASISTGWSATNPETPTEERA